MAETPLRGGRPPRSSWRYAEGERCTPCRRRGRPAGTGQQRTRHPPCPRRSGQARGSLTRRGTCSARRRAGSPTHTRPWSRERSGRRWEAVHRPTVRTTRPGTGTGGSRCTRHRSPRRSGTRTGTCRPRSARTGRPWVPRPSSSRGPGTARPTWPRHTLPWCTRRPGRWHTVDSRSRTCRQDQGCTSPAGARRPRRTERRGKQTATRRTFHRRTAGRGVARTWGS
mmetsp:Transcript_2371/g.7569  ORF Transcript_2371/g.7569 Transcript_2371/m.7569 type:complete len:225 (+) Transcript_2371:1055-1729(+)